MSEDTIPAAPTAAEFVSTHVVDAPRDLVYKAFTKADRLAQWWGPKGLQLTVVSFDPTPGGVFLYKMEAPNGFEMWGKFVYREFVAPERIVFVSSFSDADGGMTRHPMSATWPLETLSTLTLTETDGKTTLTMRGVPINESEGERKTFEEGAESMNKGFAGTWTQLDEFLGENPA